MENRKYNDLKLGERRAIISIIAYICLSIIKLLIAYMSDSAALRADGLYNATDIIASIALLIGLRLSQRPPDQGHGYGHWKNESIASMVAAFIMFAVGIQVLIDSIISMFQGGNETLNIIAAYVGVSSAIVMYFVYR